MARPARPPAARSAIAATAALAAALALGACGGGGATTTVINNTTTVTQTDTAATSTESTSTTTSTETTTTTGGGPTVALRSFQSPSGNIGCAISPKAARCDISEKQWKAPRPADCPTQVDFGQGLTLPADGAATIVCAGDTVLNPSAPVLEYGSSSRIGAITCTSQQSGMSCANESGGAFTLSRESYSLD